MKLSIIIPVYNNWNFTKMCLKDLAKLPDDHEVIIIDNGSIDDTNKFLNGNDYENLPSNLIYVRNDSNLGFAKASNQAFEKARGEYVLFLNNDIKVTKNYDNWTSGLISEAERTKGLVGPTGGLLDKRFNFIKETNEKVSGNFYMSGWCLCARKDVFQKLVLKENKYKGPFTEEFITYFEDTDMGFRADELNIPMNIVSVPVFHFGKMTSRKANLAEMYLGAKLKFVNKWTGRRK